jgi:putative redox protein
VEPSKVRRAIDLSLDKYCSVSNMIKHTAEITYSFRVNGERYEQDA